jgi:hypothetical protein
MFLVTWGMAMWPMVPRRGPGKWRSRKAHRVVDATHIDANILFVPLELKVAIGRPFSVIARGIT